MKKTLDVSHFISSKKGQKPTRTVAFGVAEVVAPVPAAPGVQSKDDEPPALSAQQYAEFWGSVPAETLRDILDRRFAQKDATDRSEDRGLAI